jgi:NADH-quinone oxidoreductase B subunit
MSLVGSIERKPYTEEEFSDARQNLFFVRLSGITRAITRGKKASIQPVNFGLACCSVELFDLMPTRIDAERWSAMLRSTPKQANVMVVAGWVTKTMMPRIKRLYEQMDKPRYVIAFGECAVCGGPWWESYNVISGVDQFLPVDVYVAGCPPRPENLFKAFVKLQKKMGGGVVKNKRK